MSKRSLSVIFPAYNEEANLAASVEGVRGVLAGRFDEFEIIIVDDGSTDRTPALADEFEAKYPGEVKVIHHDRNCKLGRTLRDGFAAAGKDLIFYTDADLPVDFRDVPRGVEVLSRNGADILVGYRLDRSESWWRPVYTAAYNWLVNTLFGLGVRDVNFSFKFFKTAALRKLALRSDGSFIDAEILARARRQGLSVAEMGVHYFPRRAGRSTLARPGVVLKILAELASFWWTEWRRPNRAP
ncbi:MAG: glycosyltransferase family 2 protein [Candidatus Zixiibacteriota bacterium]|jgi:glycosyltransferase involved in cell wall biosynthesis